MFQSWYAKEGQQDEYIRELHKFQFTENNTAMWRLISLIDNYATADLNKPGMSSKGYSINPGLGAKMGLYKPVNHKNETEDEIDIGERMVMAENAMLQAVNDAKLKQQLENEF